MPSIERNTPLVVRRPGPVVILRTLDKLSLLTGLQYIAGVSGSTKGLVYRPGIAARML